MIWIVLLAVPAIMAVLLRLLCCGRACFFGHRRNYVAVVYVRHGNYCCRNEFNACACPREGYQMARWVCDRCPAMGSMEISRQTGVYRIHFGKLVPDVKEWANENPS